MLEVVSSELFRERPMVLGAGREREGRRREEGEMDVGEVEEGRRGKTLTRSLAQLARLPRTTTKVLAFPACVETTRGSGKSLE